MTDSEKLYVRFGTAKKGGRLSGQEWFIYVEPASKVDLNWLTHVYKQKVSLSPGKLGSEEGHPNGITVWFNIGLNIADFTRGLADINRYLEHDQGWEKYTESRSAPLVGEFSYKRIITHSNHDVTAGNKSHEATELLHSLASLRDANILTEEEFQTKKSEILKRL
jgi:hypothetical protein